MGESRIRRPVLRGLGLILLLTLAACSSGPSGGANAGAPTEGSSADNVPLSDLGQAMLPPGPAGAPTPGGAPEANRPRGEPAPPDLASPPRQPLGPQIRVTWEALAVERDRAANPRFGGRARPGVLTTQKVVLVNEGHVEAKASRLGRSARQNEGVAVAAIAEADMQVFLQSIEGRGFFRLARPTVALERLFGDEKARGRITVERGGQSMTLLSLRGQGLNPATKEIPPLYSEVKRAIIMLRNRTPTMRVVGVSRDPICR